MCCRGLSLPPRFVALAVRPCPTNTNGAHDIFPNWSGQRYRAPRTPSRNDNAVHFSSVKCHVSRLFVEEHALVYEGARDLHT